MNPLRALAGSAVSLVMALAARGQQHAPSAAGGDPLRSVPVATSAVVNGDRSVTFTLRSEQARNVEIGGDFRFGRKAVGRAAIGTEATGSVSSVPMQRSAENVWTRTSEPVSPMIYRYFFVVDGTETPERRIKIDGRETLPWDLVPEIPHGTLVIEKFRSEALETVKQCVIYLPPSYGSTETRYPVLYLLHGGGGGDHRDWVDEGFADNILDYLVSTGQAKELIVVMPERALLTSAERTWLDSLGGKDLDLFVETRDRRRADYFVRDLMGFIESKYRVAKGSRAVAGLSGGGGESFQLITSRPDLFVAAGMFSASVGMARSADHEPYKTMMKQRLAGAMDELRRLKLLYLSCGDYDPLLGANRAMHEALEGLDVDHVYVEGEGAHQWPFWSRSLLDFVTRFSQAL